MSPQQDVRTPTQTVGQQVACVFPTRPGAAGHIDACQLCPASPTYWRGGPAAVVCRYDKSPVGQSTVGEVAA